MKKPEQYVSDVLTIANIQEVVKGALTKIGLEVLPPVEDEKVVEIVSKSIKEEA
ncbi:hypothetical protein FDJ25_gp013 [Vibrio phage Aphrodite1]|uniref:Uncharacterized protein n=3 Tax=Aphroditevirus TaxID=2560092 RepID=A0A2I7QI82_9CAUD|nr:hypothetical protein FDJ25_gp013 [Vibrio phage Aphrodite1]YP_009847926.1 hypothetical protein HWC35_gp190 [Vibrio phage USC-1]AUR81099.1 hypothetical protein Aphrodite1_0197 [Vibrio phage Aphrodite1]QCW23143.1 hypothetical protein [Vibrio phage 5 TSL-2019]QDH47584.1 hypothetical protein [Vibrio phage USC-1]